MKFRFSKNLRGYSDTTFKLLRLLLVGSAKLLLNPKLVHPQNMPLTGPCFLYGNHSNYYDPFLINAWMTREPAAGVMTREQFHKPMSALFMDSVGIVPTSKYVPEPGVIRQVMKMIAQRRMIVIFPEGGRRWDGRPKPLIESTLKLFYRMGIPVHPVQLHGAYLSWPRWADYPRYSNTEIHFLDPVKPADFTDFNLFAHTCRQAMNFDEYTPPQGAWPIWAYKPASGVQRLLYRCVDSGKTAGIYSPDGHHLLSRHSPLRYVMDKDSRLWSDTQQPVSLIDLFDSMQQLPMFASEGVVLHEPDSTLFTVNAQMELVKLGPARITLYTDAISMRMTDALHQVPIDDILYISIEQNHKVSLTTKSGSWQFFIQHSALQWQHYIRRLKSGEQAQRET